MKQIAFPAKGGIAMTETSTEKEFARVVAIKLRTSIATTLGVPRKK